jgi:hypothetical protein
VVDTILVTGTAGTVDSEVMKQMISRPTSYFNIKAAVHSQESGKRVVAERIKTVLIGYNKPYSIEEAFKDVESVRVRFYA